MTTKRLLFFAAVLLPLTAFTASSASAQAMPGEAFYADMTAENITEADATTASDEGPCRAFNTAPFPVDSDAGGTAVLQLIGAGGELAIHYSVTVHRTAGINEVFFAIGGPDDTWCDGRPRKIIYGGSLGGPIEPVSSGLVRSGVFVQADGTTEDLSEFDSFPGAGDGFDNFLDAMLAGEAFVVARVNNPSSPFVRGELRGPIDVVGQ